MGPCRPVSSVALNIQARKRKKTDHVAQYSGTQQPEETIQPPGNWIQVDVSRESWGCKNVWLDCPALRKSAKDSWGCWDGWWGPASIPKEACLIQPVKLDIIQGYHKEWQKLVIMKMTPGTQWMKMTRLNPKKHVYWRILKNLNSETSNDDHLVELESIRSSSPPSSISQSKIKQQTNCKIKIQGFNWKEIEEEIDWQTWTTSAESQLWRTQYRSSGTLHHFARCLTSGPTPY